MKKLQFILTLPVILLLVSCGGGGSDDLQPIEPPIDPLNINDPTDSLHTWIPDDNFEQQLINHGYDDYKDNQVLTSNILSVTAIDLRDIIQMGIPEVKDLTGIQDFISLESLYTTGNPIEKIDLSSNTELEVLIMGYCFQDTLDLSSNTKLKHLYAKNNRGFINYAKLPISIENLTFYYYKFDRSISEFTNLRDIHLTYCDFDFIIKDLQYLKTLLI